MVVLPLRGLFQMAPLKSSWSTFSTFVQKFFDRVKKWAPDYVEDVVVVMDGTESINNKCEFETGKKALRGLMSLAVVTGYPVAGQSMQQLLFSVRPA